MPPKGPRWMVVDGDVQEAEASWFGTYHGISVAHLFTGYDDVLLLDHAVVHIVTRFSLSTKPTTAK